jgi:hypothetical protein
MGVTMRERFGAEIFARFASEESGLGSSDGLDGVALKKSGKGTLLEHREKKDLAFKIESSH